MHRWGGQWNQTRGIEEPERRTPRKTEEKSKTSKKIVLHAEQIQSNKRNLNEENWEKNSKT